MPKYQKRPDLDSIYIPGRGRVRGSATIEGEYDAFVPSLLIPVPVAPLPPPPEVTLESHEIDVDLDDEPAQQAPEQVPEPEVDSKIAHQQKSKKPKK